MKKSFDGRHYRCRVKSGTEIAYSETAIVILKDLVNIVVNPEDAEVKEGNTAVFTVEAEGEELTYQWQWSTDGSTWKNCTGSGYDTSSFSFVMKKSFDGRQYRCRVKSGTEIAYSEAATVILKDAITIISNPEDTEVESGESVTFTVEAEGEDLRYQWQWSADGTTWKNCTMQGYNTTSFSFKVKASYTGRQYRCRVKSGTEIAYTDAAVLTVVSSN